MAVTAGFGELCSILSALAWAIGLMFYRQLGATMPPLQLNFLKNVLVLGMLVPAIPLLHGFALPDFTAWQALCAVLSGVLGIGVADTLYFRALNELGAGRMGVLGNFYSPFVIVLSFFFLDERLLAVQLLGFALVSLGVWVAAWPRREAEPDAVVAAGVVLTSTPANRASRHGVRGFAYAMLAIALMAVSIILVKRVLEAQPLMWVTGLRMVGALAGMAVIAWLRGESAQLMPPRTGLPWMKLTLAAFIGQFLAMVLWLAGYKYTSASVAAILNETASIFILLLAAVWLKEALTQRAIIGVVLTLTGVSCMLMVR